MAKGPELTGINTHVAVKPGYAERRMIGEGEFVPAGLPVADVEGTETVTFKDGTTKEVPISGGWMTKAPSAAAE